MLRRERKWFGFAFLIPLLSKACCSGRMELSNRLTEGMIISDSSTISPSRNSQIC